MCQMWKLLDVVSVADVDPISKFWGQNYTFSSLAANWSLTGQCFQQEQLVSLVPWCEGTKGFTSSPKKCIFCPKLPICQILAILPKKTMQTRCLGGFLLCWYKNFCFLPWKIRIFGQKTAKFGPKYAFLVIFGQILPFFAHFVQCPTKNQCEQGA